VSVCPCGHVFQGEEGGPKHNAKPGEDGVVSGEVKTETLRVSSVKYAVHKKKGADDAAPKTLRVDYWIGFARKVSEWVCLEHSGFARNKAVAWWVRRSILRPPATAAEGAHLADRGALAEPIEIVVETVAGDKFPRIVEYTLGPVPQELREIEDEPAEENWVAAASEQAGEYAGLRTNAFTPDDLDFLFGENLPDGEDEVTF
jgi:DNA repair protein RadD